MFCGSCQPRPAFSPDSPLTAINDTMQMHLEDLGYTPQLDELRKENNFDPFDIGRVVAEHKERYIVRTETGEFEAEVTGNLRFTAKSRYDFPAVGDWVALTVYDADQAIIHGILPRFSIIERQAAGQFGEIQIIAVNIDYALLVQAVDRDFNINRFERYLTICYSAKVSPIIVLTKTDLIDQQQLSEILTLLGERLPHVQVIAVSNMTQEGYQAIHQILEKGKTYCMLGSSGVGKSSLINNLSGRTVMKTLTISQSTGKGRHTTSHRELIVLESGGILIDNPGMREVGIADTTNGLETAFDHIVGFARNCRFGNCTHTSEAGCAVLEALENGQLDKDSYDNYLKMEREKAHFASTTAERRKKEKQFGKIVKDYYKKNYKNRN